MVRTAIMRAIFVVGLFPILCTPVASCGSDDAAPGASGGTGGSAGSEGDGSSGAGAGGAAGAAGAPYDAGPYALDSYCATASKESCAARKSCCTATLGYDAAECEKEFMLACEPAVEAVKNGDASFDPSTAADCIDLLGTYAGKCSDLTWSDRMAWQRAANVQCAIFRGKVGVDGDCTSSLNCAPTLEADAWTTCGTQGKCKTVRFLKENDACSLPGPEADTCDDGLYCNAPTFPPGELGTCIKATARGAACDTAVEPNLECGLGSFCDAATGKCTEATKGAGESCTYGFECRSGSCAYPGAFCTEPAPVDVLACGADPCAKLNPPDGTATTCSGTNTTPVSEKITNNCAVAIQVFWVDQGCQENPYGGDIAPGQSYQGQTYVSHAWRVREARSGRLLKELGAPADATPWNVAVP